MSSGLNCVRKKSVRKSWTKQDCKTKAGWKAEACQLWEKWGPGEKIRAELETEKVPGRTESEREHGEGRAE